MLQSEQQSGLYIKSFSEWHKKTCLLSCAGVVVDFLGHRPSCCCCPAGRFFLNPLALHVNTDRACEPQPSRSCFHVSATTGAALVFPPFFLKVIIIKSSSYDKTNCQKEGFMELMSGFTGSSLPVVRTVKIETSGGWQMRLKSLKSVAEGKNDLIK